MFEGNSPPLWRPLATADGSVVARLRDNNFDALRLVFASMVVLYHVGLLSQEPALHSLTLVSATFAVQAFFVVSGFLVTMSYEKSSSLSSYVDKRLRRITPAYITVVVVAAITLSLISSLPPFEYFASSGFWRYLGRNIVLANFSAPSLPGVFQSNFVTAVNGSLWTIKIEVAFYCFVPIMVWAVRRFGSTAVLVTIFLGSLAWRVGFEELASNTGRELYGNLAKQLPGQLGFFSGGAWAYYRTQRGHTANIWLALGGLLAYYFAGSGLLYSALAPVAVVCVVYWAAVAGPRLPALGRYGDFSYGVYLYHFPILQTLIALGIFRHSPAVGVILLILLVAICAFSSWHLIEKPFLARKRA